MLKFDIDDYPIEIKSDHAPLFATLNFALASPHNIQIIDIQKKTLSKGKIMKNLQWSKCCRLRNPLSKFYIYNVEV